MERAGVRRRRLRRRLRRQPALQQPLHPPVQLRRRAAREGRQHDALRVGARQDEVGDAMREHIGLAGAGAGDDEQRLRAVRIADAMLHREPLRVVQVSQGSGANRGEHVRDETGFAVCSQEREMAGRVRMPCNREATGNLLGNPSRLRKSVLKTSDNSVVCENLPDKFPARQNRELIRPEQGTDFRPTGN